MPSDLTLSSIDHSNLPSSQKSQLRRWYDAMHSKHGARAKHHLTAGAEAVRAGGESIVTGAALAAAHAHLPSGLDINGKVPADALIGIAGLIASAAMKPGDAVTTDIRNIGAAAAAVYSFRKGFEFMAARKVASGSVPGGVLGPAKAAAKVAGEFGNDVFGAEDPIVALARNL